MVKVSGGMRSPARAFRRVVERALLAVVVVVLVVLVVATVVVDVLVVEDEELAEVNMADGTISSVVEGRVVEGGEVVILAAAASMSR